MARYNVGKFGNKMQMTLYGDENRELKKTLKKGEKNMANKKYQKKTYSKPVQENTGRRKIVDVDAWINIGGKGFFVKIEGREYMTSIDNIQALLEGEKKGVKLGLLQ